VHLSVIGPRRNKPVTGTTGTRLSQLIFYTKIFYRRQSFSLFQSLFRRVQSVFEMYSEHASPVVTTTTIVSTRVRSQGSVLPGTWLRRTWLLPFFIHRFRPLSKKKISADLVGALCKRLGDRDRAGETLDADRKHAQITFTFDIRTTVPLFTLIIYCLSFEIIFGDKYYWL